MEGTTKEKKRKYDTSKKHKKRKKCYGGEIEIINTDCTNANPFGGDSNVVTSFDWKLKREKEKREGKRSSKPSLEEQEQHKESVMKEIEKLKRQREERDNQKRLWEEERTKQARLREQSCYGELSKKEDEFHLAQAKIRAQTRLKENRAKPIDYFYIALKPDELPLDFAILSPAKVFKPLGKHELEDLLQEIRLFIELDSNVEYWNSLLILINHKLAQIPESNTEYDDGVHTAVVDDIDAILDGKSEKELVDLEQLINTQLAKGEALDEEYWQSLLKRLRIRKAAAKVDEMHANIVEERLLKLAKIGTCPGSQIEMLRKKMRSMDSPEDNIGLKQVQSLNLTEKKRGSSSNTGTLRAVRKILTEDEMYELEEAKGMEEDEEKFSQEFILPNAHLMESITRYIKPRYYNRVKTGYEWNKYNQVHYDLDSPPPKVVQGYKFNIFYPELIDKSNPPTYKIHQTENPDLVILHFQSGLPYQDIAFKIVNGEWEYSQKTGFKCMFSNGILHLWFNFKKYRYRR